MKKWEEVRKKSRKEGGRRQKMKKGRKGGKQDEQDKVRKKSEKERQEERRNKRGEGGRKESWVGRRESNHLGGPLPALSSHCCVFIHSPTNI